VINVNDLIGLTYGWGHRPDDNSGFTDCFQLACEIHRRFGLADYAPAFDWVYSEFDDDTFPRVRMARWLLQNGSRLTTPQPAAVILLPSDIGAALGTVMDDGSTVFIGPSHNVVRAKLPEGTGQLFWMER
jgi:hypothetical protein